MRRHRRSPRAVRSVGLRRAARLGADSQRRYVCVELWQAFLRAARILEVGKMTIEFDWSRNHPLRKVQERAAQNAASHVIDLADQPEGDSPIEQILSIALISEIHSGCHEHSEIFCCRRGEISRFDDRCAPLGEAVLIVERQIDIGGWRVDFLIHTHGFSPKLIVECDGHDFHERTKEQAAKDRARDREFQANGYTVFRFTGSEIWRDPCKCADQILGWAVGVEPFR